MQCLLVSGGVQHCVWRSLTARGVRVCLMTFHHTLFHAVPRQYKLERKVDLLQHALSSESLALFPDFQQRLEVLRRYVLYDASNSLYPIDKLLPRAWYCSDYHLPGTNYNCQLITTCRSTVSITNRRVPTTFANYLPLREKLPSSAPNTYYCNIHAQNVSCQYLWYFVFDHLHVARYRLLPIPSCNQPTSSSCS